MQSLLTFVLCTLILGIGLWLYRKSFKAYEKFPFPTIWHSFVFGLFLKPKDIPATSYTFNKLLGLSKRFEKEGMFLYWSRYPVLVIFNEEAVKVFSNEKSAIDKASDYDMLKDIMGEGTITCNGEDWKRRRKMFNPVFYSGMLKSYISTLNEYSITMTKELTSATNRPINMLDYLKEFSFCVVSEFLLGIKMREGEAKELGKRFLNFITKSSEYASYRMALPWMRYQIFQYSTTYSRKNLKCYDERNRLLLEIISEMKKATSHRSSEIKSEDESGYSFAATLLEHNLHDPYFTNKDMQDELLTYLSAGYDTVTYTLLWCLFLLGHHQDIQNKVLMEIKSTTEEEYITYDDIHRLKYLQCVIKETLRLYPTVPIYLRSLKHDVQCGKYKVPKGTEISFFPYRLHRNSEIFPDPENFNPDRFLDGTVEKRPWTYVPFAEGIRSCIGKKFAVMEMTVFLTYLIRRYRIQSLVEKESVQFDWAVTLMPVKPLFMQLTPRNENAK